MAKKLVYFFGSGKAEGNATMKELLGGKGANLAEMTNLGIPVPPGFTIATRVCDDYYKNKARWPKGLAEEINKNIAKLEKVMNAKLGDPNKPLLVSVRSGAKISMPGMMNTVLNLGLNDTVIEGIIKKTGNARFSRLPRSPPGFPASMRWTCPSPPRGRTRRATCRRGWGTGCSERPQGRSMHWKVYRLSQNSWSRGAGCRARTTSTTCPPREPATAGCTTISAPMSRPTMRTPRT